MRSRPKISLTLAPIIHDRLLRILGDIERNSHRKKSMSELVNELLAEHLCIEKHELPKFRAGRATGRVRALSTMPSYITAICARYHAADSEKKSKMLANDKESAVLRAFYTDITGQPLL